jgi:hypothetical protein
MIPHAQCSKTFLFRTGLVCMLFLPWIPGCAKSIHTRNQAAKKPSPNVIIREYPDVPIPKELALDKEARKDVDIIPGSGKVSASLRAVMEEMAARGMTRQNARELGASALSNPLVRVNEEGSIQTYIYVHTFGAEEKALLETYGVTIEITNEELGIIQAWVPFDRIDEVAGLPFVKRITPPSYATLRVGSVTTEGEEVIRESLKPTASY